MNRGVIIDGNNLLFAVQALAPVKALGREAMVRRIDQWAKTRSGDVVIAFDGAAPGGGLKRQLSPSRLDVRFSAPRSADDLIVELIALLPDPGAVEIVSDDKAILYEARRRGCRAVPASAFVMQLFAPDAPIASDPPTDPSEPLKLDILTPEERARWRREFGVSDDDPPDDGFDAMRF